MIKDGIGSAGDGPAGSDSLVLRRDRGRCSPVERMKVSFDNSPLAPDELRFLPGAGGRLEEGGTSDAVPARDVVCSMVYYRRRSRRYPGLNESNT